MQQRLAAALGALVAFGLVGCAPDDRREVDGVAREVLSVPPTDSIVPIGVPKRAYDEKCQMEPIRGSLARPLELIELVDVHLLRVRSDRGEEVVRIHGLGGQDERLPEELNEYLAGTARESISAWLTAPEWALVELSPERFVTRGALGGPDLRDRDGYRVVSVGRRERGKPATELGPVALREGWAWPAHPGEDALGLDPRRPFLKAVFSGNTRGLYSLPAVQENVAAYLAEAAEVDAMEAEAFQQRGRDLQARVATWLGWTPLATLEFQRVPADEAAAPLSVALQASRTRTLECLQNDVRRMEALTKAGGSVLKVELDLDLPPFEEELEALLPQVHAFSTAGPEVWVVQRGDLTEPLLDLLLVREILRQYQEEVLSEDGGYPICGMPQGLEEAHAARLAAYFLGYGEGVGRVDGDPRSFRLYGWISEELGLQRDDVLARMASGEWDAGLWTALAEGRMGLQEWSFRQLGTDQWEQLRFESVTSPDYLPRVRVTNDGSRRFDGQFHGQWMWRVSGGGKTIASLRGAPLNLALAPGGTVILELAREDHWRDLPPTKVVGLFSSSSRREPKPPAPPTK